MLFKSRAQIFSFAVCTTIALVVIGLGLLKFKGIPSRLSPDALKYVNGETRLTTIHDVSLKKALAGDFPELGNGNKQLPIDLLVWGDSHAMALLPLFDVLCKEHSVRGVVATHSGTAPLVGVVSSNSVSLKAESIPFNDAVISFIRSKRIQTVVIAAKWSGGEENRWLRQGLEAAISALRGTDTRVLIMGQVPNPKWDVPHTLAFTFWLGRDTELLGLPLGEYRKKFQSQCRIFEEVASEFPGITVLDPSVYFVNPNKLCRVEKDSSALYSDDNHLTVAGAMLLRPLFEPIFQGIRKE